MAQTKHKEMFGFQNKIEMKKNNSKLFTKSTFPG